MKIKNAVIILGPGKSGTTLFNNILSLHKDLYYISSYLNKFPEKTYLALLNNLNQFSWYETNTRNRSKVPKPAESFQFWSYYVSDFNKNLEVYNSKEITNALKAVKRVGHLQSGSRLIVKLTGPSRLEFLEQLFEDPYIIWIDRDPKAIIASFYSNKWRYKDRQEQFRSMAKSEIITEYANYYKWIDIEKNRLKKFRFLHIHYESLIDNPLNFFKNVCEFAELDFYKKFEHLIEAWDIKKNTYKKYLKFFDKDDLQLINKILSQ